jgi:hypothetical protein
LVLDVKVEENKETPEFLSLPIKFVCGISHAKVNYFTNSAVNLQESYILEFSLKKLYLLYIGMEGVCDIHSYFYP